MRRVRAVEIGGRRRGHAGNFPREEKNSNVLRRSGKGEDLHSREGKISLSRDRGLFLGDADSSREQLKKKKHNNGLRVEDKRGKTARHRKERGRGFIYAISEQLYAGGWSSTLVEKRGERGRKKSEEVLDTSKEAQQENPLSESEPHQAPRQRPENQNKHLQGQL